MCLKVVRSRKTLESNTVCPVDKARIRVRRDMGALWPTSLPGATSMPCHSPIGCSTLIVIIAFLGRRRAVHRPRGLGRSLLARVSFAERGLAEFALATYHIQHVDAITVVTVEDPAAWLNDLAIAPATQFLWFRATVRVSDQTGRARSSSASVPQSSPWSKRGGSGLCFTERMRPELHTSCPLGCTDPKL